jgi:hypothetical protein
MVRRATSLVCIFGVIAITACGHAHWPKAQTPNPRTRAGGRCPPSGIHANGSCPKVNVPAVNASSPTGCKSDAECAGWDPRCVENPTYDRSLEPPSGSASIRRAGALLGAAPRPPAPTMCVSDACHVDADCGVGMGCECGTGRGVDRNRCIAIDVCQSDSDCKQGQRCECDREGPNYCLASNCDSDAECGGLACADAPSGRFCRTKDDTCARDADCPPKSGFLERCDYDVTASRWRCIDVEPPPPG